MNKPERLKASKIGQPLLSLIDHPEQSHAMLSSGSQQIVSGGKVVSFITLDDDLSFRLPDELIETLGLTVGSKLLAGRGSGLGLAFIARGRICEEALGHLEAGGPGLQDTVALLAGLARHLADVRARWGRVGSGPLEFPPLVRLEEAPGQRPEELHHGQVHFP